jgi:subtilisin-like proprotein convertase family protein
MVPFKLNRLSRAFLVSSVSFLAIEAVALPQQNTPYHQDYRTSIKYDQTAQLPQASGNNDIQQARSFLQLHASRYQLPASLNTLRFKKVKESQSAKHFVFEQHIDGIPIHAAEVIVSISKANNRVTRVFNQSHPTHLQSNSGQAVILKKEALSTAWDQLGQYTQLKQLPEAELVYFNLGMRNVLAYRIKSAVGNPLSTWQHMVDAKTGQVLSHKQITVPAKGHAMALSKTKSALSTLADKPSFNEALAELNVNKHSQAPEENKVRVLATGSAVVFDPDPRTTLENASLEDSSSPASFGGAYLNRSLLDITLDGGVYRLEGPWVNIDDWDTPSTAPSTTADGNWTALRGDNAFNDVNVYFHIDQNQRYIQSLGFTGTTGIQETSITADTDGNNGEDQSIYMPFGNRLSFGHGGVDDAEDADVILHEYGHALHYGIISNWGGGDTGALGEGFGDYWAGSYSLSTENGRDFNPNWVFTWDGHNSFWAGRRMDIDSATYDPDIDYQAHATVNGINGDELWSTPLFQSLQELIALGETRESVDRIVLESFFGLGSGIKMHELASSTIAAANALEPDGPHAEVFATQFERFNLLPLTLGIQSDNISSGSEPITAGDTFNVSIPLENLSGSTLSNISATLTSTTSGVVINQGSSNYDNLDTGANGSNLTSFSVSAPNNMTCAQVLSFSLQVDYTSDGIQDSTTLNFDIDTAQYESFNVTSTQAIPDNVSTGINSTNSINTSTGSISSLTVDVNITHTYRGDLELYLNSPNGTRVQLKSSAQDNSADLIGNYPRNFEPAEALSAFNGENPNGTWTLNVADVFDIDQGTLNSWQLNIAQCATSPTPSPAPASPTPSPSNNSGGGGGGSSNLFLLSGLFALFCFKRKNRGASK